jgi:hypothetical protein
VAEKVMVGVWRIDRMQNVWDYKDCIRNNNNYSGFEGSSSSGLKTKPSRKPAEAATELELYSSETSIFVRTA